MSLSPMQDLISQFRDKADIHESRCEIVIGEVVRAMARLGYPSVNFRLQGDAQLIQFRAVGHPSLYAVHVLIEHPLGAYAATNSSPITLRITAESRCRSTDATDLLRLARSDSHTEAATTFEGDIHVEREMSSLLARTNRIIDLDVYVGTGANGTRMLVAMLRTTVAALADAISRHESVLA